MVKRKRTKEQTMIYKTLHIKRTPLKTGGELGAPKDKSYSFSTHPEALN